MEYQEIEIKDFDIRDFYSSFIFNYPKPVWHTTDGMLAWKCDCHAGHYQFMRAEILPNNYIRIFVNVDEPESELSSLYLDVVIFGEIKRFPICPYKGIEFRYSRNEIKDKMEYIINRVKKAQSKERELL